MLIWPRGLSLITDFYGCVHLLHRVGWNIDTPYLLSYVLLHMMLMIIWRCHFLICLVDQNLKSSWGATVARRNAYILQRRYFFVSFRVQLEQFYTFCHGLIWIWSYVATFGVDKLVTPLLRKLSLNILLHLLESMLSTPIQHCSHPLKP